MRLSKIKKMDTFSGVYEIEVYKKSYLCSNCNVYFNNSSPNISLNERVHFFHHYIKKETPYPVRLRLDWSFLGFEL